MTPRPALSKMEMQVARIVWDLEGATVRDVLESLKIKPKPDYKTVQTYLRRLEAKGYLRSKREGRSLFYTPHAKPKQVIRDAVKDFTARLFGGEALPLMEHLIQDRDMTSDEIKRLKNLIEQLEDDQNESSKS